MHKDTLKVNSNENGQMYVNVMTKVNSQKIRRVTHAGREHLVMPSYTLPANVVMNGGLYPASEIDKHYHKLEGTLAPLGHPEVDGRFVSAFSPEGINVGHIGAFNRNVKKSGNRVYVEKWLDLEFAKNTEGGRRLIERVEAIEAGEDVPPIHTSVAVFLEQLEATEEQRAAGIEWVARIHEIDHDAILLDEPGAATPEQGVGLLVNADAATPVEPVRDALDGMTFRERERLLERAAREQLVDAPDQIVWVADFTLSQAIIIKDQGDAFAYDYTIENDVVKFSLTADKVERHESWVKVVANRLRGIFKSRAQPDVKSDEGIDMAISEEDRAELTREISEAVVNQINEHLAPLTQKVEELAANHQELSDRINNTEKAAEDAMRAEVAVQFGEVVANSLSGDALRAMHGKIAKTTALAPDQLSTNSGASFTADLQYLPKE